MLSLLEELNVITKQNNNLGDIKIALFRDSELLTNFNNNVLFFSNMTYIIYLSRG